MGKFSYTLLEQNFLKNEANLGLDWRGTFIKNFLIEISRIIILKIRKTFSLFGFIHFLKGLPCVT